MRKSIGLQFKPTVLFILHLPPPVHGAAMMGKYIHDSKLINGEFDCHYINLTTASSLQDIGHWSAGKLWKYVKLLGRVAWNVIKLRPKLVYVTPNAKGGGFYKDFVVVMLLKLLRCKIVVHYHNKGVSTRQGHWLDDKLYRCFFKGLKVILLAEALYKDVEKYVRHEDVFICPNGIPDTLKQKPDVERHNAVPRLLFLSNLLVSKGVLVLLDACKMLKDKGYAFSCEFVGGETADIDAERFKKEVENRGLDKLTAYFGKKYGEEKEIFWLNADVFVFPTMNECFPLVLLEAMEHGMPCVTSQEGGISDIVVNGETGIIVEKVKPELVANAIENLLQSPAMRESMGCKARERFAEHFTLLCFERRMHEVLQTLITMD